VAGTALLAEIPAVVVGWTTAAWYFVLSPFTNNFEFFGERFEAQPVFGVALGLLAVGWFLMGARQQPIGDGAPFGRAVQASIGRHAWLVVPAAVAAVAQGTASGPATAATCVGLAAVLATAPRRAARLISAALALWAPLTTVSWQWACVVAGLAGAAAVTWAARSVARRSSREWDGGSLVAGTVVLVAVTVHESLGTLASVPTWGWLAAGGSLLLAVGVSLERRGAAGPVEAGRRLVDVVAERFS
jgi:hypothetical protein